MPKKKYQSPVAEVVHKGITGLHRLGLTDKVTMRHFDASCLQTIEQLTPQNIKDLRVKEGVSQKVFAICLNVSPKLIGEWERGEKHPSGPSLKLLSLIKTKGLGVLLPTR